MLNVSNGNITNILNMYQGKIFFLAMLLSASLTAKPGTITEQEALQKAQEVMKGKTLSIAKSQLARTRADAASDESGLFFFNAEHEGGFVIVSADDRTEAIVGYSDEGCINLDDMPENLRFWLDGYKEQIRLLDGDNVSTKRVDAPVNRPAIAPLIKTLWGQNSPYKNNCPIYKDLTSVTGCVATAMAQLMYYYQYPAGSPALPAYQTDRFKISVEEKPETLFRWDKMRTSYNKDALGETADAVAELMRYCGQAVGMDYSPSGSESNDEKLIYGMINYFGYDKNTRIISRANYTQNQWEDILYEELSAGRPVIYSGADSNSNGYGHEFICDGCDENGLFHFNWGWDGAYNGYFVASLANYKTPQKGLYGSLDGFTFRQAAIIGLQPDTGKEHIPLIGSAANIYSKTYIRDSSADDFKDVNLKGYFIARYITPPTEYDVETGWGLYQGDDCFDIFVSKTIPFGKKGESFIPVNFPHFDYTFLYEYLARSADDSYSFGSGLPIGNYQLRQVYRHVGETVWKFCEPLQISNNTNYLVAEIGEQTLTLKGANSNGNYVVNDVWTSDDPTQGKPFKVTVNLTNTGDTYQEVVYLYFDDELVSSVMASIEPGNTGEVTLSFVPKSYGSSKKLTIKDGLLEEKWSGTIEETREIGSGLFDEATNYYEFQDDGKSVVLVTVNKTDDGKLVVPSSVKYHGKDYEVIGVKGASSSSVCKDPDELTEVVLPSTVRFLGDFAFYFCMNLFSVTWNQIEESALTEIGVNVFTSCTNLKALSLPTGLTSIGESALAGCISLPAFTLDEACDSFAVVDGLIYNKEKTKLINCPAGKAGIVTLPATVKTIESNAFYNCTQVTDVIMPEGLDSLGLAVFVGCSSLKTIKIPESVRVIGFGGFTGCTNLESIDVAPNNATYSSLDGILIENGNRLMAYPNKKGQAYEVPEGIYVIETFACCWTDLQEVILPRIVSMGNYSFAYCHDLMSVTALQLNPFEIPDNCFSEETYENATLYVPEGSVEKYRTTEGWRNFVHIMEIGETGISNLETDIKPFDIYDVKGHKVRTAATTLDNLPKGIYIVNGRKMMK